MAVDKDKLQEEASIVRFCKIILGWDYFRLLKFSNKNHKAAVVSGVKEVKDTYKDVDDYLATFEPLLFEEVKAQIVQRKDDEEVTNWKLRLVMECNEADGFHLPAVTYEADEEESIAQNDLLLLSKEKFKEGSKKLPTTYAFALVEHRQKNLLRLRMNLAGEFTQVNPDVEKISERLIRMQALITSSASAVEKRVFSIKICSLSTIAREYIALCSVGSLPFKDLILKAAERDSGFEDQAWKISGSLHDYFKENLNKSQQEAIDGPPGTGKTQTILGLLSAILHATPGRVHSKGGLLELNRGPELPIEEKYKHWGRASPWLMNANPRDIIMPFDGDDGFFPTSGNELKPEVVNSSRKYRMRVLVCAPSNSALDEIVFRLLKTGVRDENVRTYTPKIVRIGLKPHHSVEAVSMDYLVNQKRDLVGDKQKQLSTARDIDSIRAAILDEAAIVFSTLSFSGSAVLTKLNSGFDVVIIDEAAQAVEPATLVPLSSGCKQVFLIGDPVQLPATVISPIAEKFGYGTSLFKRFQKAGYPVKMLKTQYRMHPEIRSFPSKEFYDEALEDGSDVQDQTTRDWHKYGCFGPFCFFDIHEGKESQPSGSGSWVNIDEIEFVLVLYHKLITMYPELKSSSQFAIISPYRHQVKLLQERFQETFGVESKKVVDIGTIDGFQGREKDVVIFSCVRASKDRGIGFVSDFRRMNVGITRAKSSVLVVGSASTLKNDEHWRNLVESAEKRGCFFKVTKPYVSFFSDEHMESMKVINKDAQMVDIDAPDNENNVAYNTGGDADQGPVEDNDYGDGGGDEGGFDDD
ncbi:probable helicase MAGATAMA 3 isoform X2 [Durio zibethinus]|uniref:Probable helicase MAGATAMA 3 isoform X2 n=1 Tax=Durio zibethinus TaxID=66656 RepID=A0A6P6ADM9_DURZI|nr:probable helicase MAGATAMA 3 isoform X2 [Durio zibethinus]